MNRSTAMDQTATSRGRWIALAVLGLSAAICGIVLLSRDDDRQHVDKLVKQAEQHFYRAEYELAERAAVEALELNPLNGDAALLAGRAAEELESPRRAVDYLNRVIPVDGDLFAEAAIRAATILHYSLTRLSDAEDRYRQILETDPDSIPANEGLARLLSVCGRRDEALPHVMRLIRTGLETDLVILLARESGSLNDAELLQKARRSDPDDPNPLIGMAWSLMSTQEPDAAIEHLKTAVALRDPPPAAWGLLIRLLATTEAWDDVATCASNLPPSAGDLADTWLARALAAEHQQDRRGAIRAWLEVLKRRPESRQAASQLPRLLAAEGMTSEALRIRSWAETLEDVSLAQHRALFSDDDHSYDDLVRLVVECRESGRWWEALAWGRVARQMDNQDARIAAWWSELQEHTATMPLQVTLPSFNPAKSIELAQFAIPEFLPAAAQQVAASGDLSKVYALHDVATAVGLVFQYFNGTAGLPTHRMYEFSGGGIAVVDLDRDDRPDVFLTQGTTWPPTSRQDSDNGEGFSDALFRNGPDGHFADVANIGGVADSDFSQGAAIGDIDDDGFPDLLVANIGKNRLWLNNGDGTFRSAELPDGEGSALWTTSCLVADLNGDHIADLYDVNYVTAADVFERVCRGSNGQPVMCAPHDFDPAPDQIWLGNGSGGFVRGTDSVLEAPDQGNGLGVVAFREAQLPGLTLFIANDKTANALLRLSADGSGRLRDESFSAGVAFNGRGESEACMGIAVADADQNGLTDLFVTNFWHESNTLYLATTAGYFTDQTPQNGLGEPSHTMLGFGTQFLDIDLDSIPELFVTNGHIEDVGLPDQPYRMPPQLFARSGNTWRQIPAEQLSGYFQGRWVGRSAARIDWNRDGRDDLLVSHLDSPLALLSNATTEAGGGLSLRLTGDTAGRDAIGTIVTYSVGGVERVVQLSAGDGYQCSNERRINAGCGSGDHVDTLTIRWPSGRELRVEGLPVPGRYAADEKTNRLYSLPDGPADETR